MQPQSTPAQAESFGDVYTLLMQRFIRLIVYASFALVWMTLSIHAFASTTAADLAFYSALFVSAAGGAALFIIRFRRFVPVAVYVLLLGLLGTYAVIPVDPVSAMVAAGMIVPAAFLAHRYAFYAITAVIVARLGVIFLESGGLSDAIVVADRLLLMGGFITLAAAARLFSVTLHEAAVRSQRVNDLLRAAADVGQATSTLLDLNEMFSRAVELIRERFGVYHTQIFLVDDAREYASLVASTGEVGKRLLERGHRLAVGSQSVIGRVTQLGEVIVTRDTEGGVHARNELLPNTRAEVALPIIDNERIVGALDLQSTRVDAFDAIDVQALQVMAGQLATAYRNVRLFAAQTASVQENKRLLFEAEANLREIQRLNRQLTRTAWDAHLQERPQLEGITLEQDGLKPGAEWTPAMIEASQRQRPVMPENQPVISVPIVLRGEVLGAIEVIPGADGRKADSAEVIQAVAQRLAISLDNARLFEETEAATRQAQRINTIVSRYQAADTVSDLLQITLTELSDSLGAQRAAIRIGNVLLSTDQTASNGHQGPQDGVPEL